MVGWEPVLRNWGMREQEPSSHLSTSPGPVWPAARLVGTYPLLDIDRPVMDLDLGALPGYELSA